MSDPASPHAAERELRRLNRTLRMLSDSNQALIRITDEAQLLKEVCRVAVEVGGYRMAWVGFPENDERKTVRIVAVQGGDEAYLESMGIVWADEPRGRGPAGTAIRTGQVRIIHDVRTDPDTAPWREAARVRGFESILALPLLSEGRVLGALSVNASEAGAFDAEELKILTELAGDLSFGLAALRRRAEHARAEELLHKSGEVFRAIVENSPDLILRFDRELKLTYVNPALCQMFGLPAEAFLHRPIGASNREVWAVTNPEGVAQVCQTVAMIFADGVPRELSVRWPTPRGQRVFGVRYFPERDRAGAVATVLVIGRDITERRQAEEAMQNVLRHARTTVMQSLVSAPDEWDRHEPEWSAPNFRWDSHFEDEVAAQAVLPLELAPGEKYYAGWVRAKHPDDQWPMALTAARAFVGGATSWRQEFRATDRHGRLHWFTQVASLLSVAPGRWQVTTVNTDITERKLAEEAVHESRARLEMANRATRIGPWDWDLLTNEVAFSAEWKRQIGYEADELPDRFEEWEGRLHPDDRERVLNTVRAYRSGERPDYEVEFRLRHKDGSYRWIFTRGEFMRGADGQPCRMIGCHLDITERKRAEDELRRRTALFEAQVDSTLDAILVVDGHGKKIIQNERMNELWKIPREIVENPDDSEQLRFVTSRTKKPEQFAAKVAHLNSHPDAIGRDELETIDGRVIDRYSAPVRDRSGKYYGRIWTFRDVTATRHLEEQFRQAQKMEAVGQLAGGIAHDFNNLLTVIHLQTSMILLEKSLGEAVAQSVQQIKEAATRAANLTRQLLTFSRQNVTQARALDIGEVVSSTTKLLRRVLGEDMSLESRFAPGLPLVHADPGMMEQVLMNLVINARDAMPGGGRLSIALDAVDVDASHVATNPAARIGRFVRLSVSDTGHGIAPEILPRIFEPFFTTKEMGKGTGLGLATVYGILQQHEGWIEAESEVGRGSTFHVFLPALEEIPPGEVAVLAPEVRGGVERVLIVEDEAIVRAVATAALQRRGYQVTNASTAADALRIWGEQQGQFDLLLTDLIMPGGISGQKLAEELTARQPGLKIVFTSGYSDEVVTRQLRLTPGQNFLPKPYPLEDLLRIVRQKLDEA